MLQQMAQPALPTPPPSARGDHDDIVVLRGAAWSDYERILSIRGDASVPRVTFLKGLLELMSPSKSHESIKSVIGCLVEAWCVEKGIDITPYGSWTLQDAAVERGAEPDECYIVGDKDAERPDLAIEVVWTSGGIDKLEVYRKLRVQEVWIHEKGTLRLFALRGERYEPLAASEVLSGIDHEPLCTFVMTRPMTRAVREFREALLRG
jgi:Uma2 family endonuclease